LIINDEGAALNLSDMVELRTLDASKGSGDIGLLADGPSGARYIIPGLTVERLTMESLYRTIDGRWGPQKLFFDWRRVRS